MNDILARLTATIEARKGSDPGASYVGKLFSKGDDAILKKIGEEATELVMAAKDRDPARVTSEAADLLFHMMVALAAQGLTLADVLAELERREGTSGIDEKNARNSKQHGA
jgi:phosphoribosyl-ATP pyrophosphohydrolase